MKQLLKLRSLFAIMLLGFAAVSCKDEPEEPDYGTDYGKAVEGVYVGTGTVYTSAGSVDQSFDNMRIELYRESDTRVSLKMVTSAGASFFSSSLTPYCEVAPAKGGFTLTAEWSSSTVITVSKNGVINYEAPIKKGGVSGYTIKFTGEKSSADDTPGGSGGSGNNEPMHGDVKVSDVKNYLKQYVSFSTKFNYTTSRFNSKYTSTLEKYLPQATIRYGIMTRAYMPTSNDFVDYPTYENAEVFGKNNYGVYWMNWDYLYNKSVSGSTTTVTIDSPYSFYCLAVYNCTLDKDMGDYWASERMYQARIFDLEEKKASGKTLTSEETAELSKLYQFLGEVWKSVQKHYLYEGYNPYGVVEISIKGVKKTYIIYRGEPYRE